MDYPQARTVVALVLAELGLADVSVADAYGDTYDPVASTDATTVQVVHLLNKAGRKLCNAHNWSQLTMAGGFSTSNGVASYSNVSPNGLRVLPNSIWNQEQQRQLIPVTPQQWEQLQASVATGLVGQAIRFAYNNAHIYPTPTAVETIIWQEVTNLWVVNNDSYNQDGVRYGGETTVTDSAHHLTFDLDLLVAATVLEWKRTKGFDTTTAQEDYDKALAASRGGDGLPPTLSISSCGPAQLINLNNLDTTGYP